MTAISQASHAAALRVRSQFPSVSRSSGGSSCRQSPSGAAFSRSFQSTTRQQACSSSRRQAALVHASTVATDLKQVIQQLIERKDLTQEQAQAAMEGLIAGAEAAQIGAFLVLLRAKGETPEEVAGLAAAMRSMCVEVAAGDNTLDIVGTGGDGFDTVNISTGACVLAAACGAHVAKHGNRSVSSACGSADVLEALNVEVDLGPQAVARCVQEAGVGFMYAPRFHPAMRIVAPVRKALKVRTAFNLLGPMLNPSFAPYALVGVFNPETVDLMARSLQRLGIRRALVVHSKGLDEISPMGPADMLEVTQDSVRPFRVDPLDYGIARCTIEDLKGGDKALNAQLLRDAFGGQQGAIADALVLNAGTGLAACGVAKDVGEGIAMAQEAQRSGKALLVLDRWAALSQELKKAEQLAVA
ncbi:unnamed protein product [Closterium sp. NIES-64]|nr:unnamed protein product [Closterium sp. NIES-65]CAI5980537.1 unnamed protein product [Closterium sp. NIES-64]